MKLFKNWGVIFLILFVSFSAYKIYQKRQDANENIVGEVEYNQLPSSFKGFYEKFHKDSLYQIAHITFPLDGYPASVDSVSAAQGGFRWYPETWLFLKLDGLNDSFYVRKFKIPLAGFVEETIQQKQTPFATYRRFAKNGDEWQLIFYSDMNPMRLDETQQMPDAK